MSAALQFPSIARAAAAQRRWQAATHPQPQPERDTPAPPQQAPSTRFGPASSWGSPPTVSHSVQAEKEPNSRPAPPPNLAFYRKHTGKFLRSYLYSSILVGRSPSIFTQQIIRGRASSRPVHTFEDCVIFVIDMEKALAQISALDRLLITRVVLQEYTLPETALLLNKSQRLIGLRLADALDRLTRILLDNGTLSIPTPRELEGDSRPAR
jgi:hypothetical protein